MKKVRDSRFVCLYGVDTEEYPELAYIEDGIKHSYRYDDTIVDWVVEEMKKSGVCKDYAYNVNEYNQPTYMQKKTSPDGKYVMYYDGMGTIEIWGEEYPMSDSRKVKDNIDEYGDYETEVAVYINGADNLSNEEANVLTDALKELVDYNRYNSNEGSWCEAYEFETLDRVGEGESVGVWGNAAGDSYDTIYNAFYSWTEQWAIDNGYDIEVQLFDAD